MTGRAWIGAAMVLAAAALWAPTPARACSYSDLSPGLTVYSSDAKTIAADGVLAFDAYFFGADIADVSTRFTLTVTRDGAPVAGSLEFLTLWSGAPGFLRDEVVEDATLLHQLVIVWRPAAPLAPGAYAGVMWVEYPGGTNYHDEMNPLAITVTDAPGPPLAAPEFEAIGGEMVAREVLEQACCETGYDSCSHDSLCKPTRVFEVPGFRIGTALPEIHRERAYLWVAQFVDGTPGAPQPTHTPWLRPWEDSAPLFAQWSDFNPVGFDEARDEYCVVLGATSLIDGSSATSEPFCATLAGPREETLTPEFALYTESDDPWDCLEPPVYAHNGEPYPEGAEEPANQGCRIAGGGAWGLLMVVGLRRRRPTRSQNRTRAPS